MCLLEKKVYKMQFIAVILLLTNIPSSFGRCGCQKAPGQGFFANGKRAAGFESLSQSVHDTSGENGRIQYTVPNFRVLLFQPTFLDFQEQAVGMPYVQSVILSNPSDTNDIEITAINVQPPFHASQFKKKVLSPLQNMTLDLVFLATMTGNVENTAYIYTSKGNFPYQVFGIGVKNPYRLRSFVTARIPVNGTFAPYINMYNPYTEPIQISEMYSSGSDLHLDLLVANIVNDTTSKLWHISPYETKPIMKATYYSKEEGVAVRFIRIVLGPPAPPSEVLIIPFEMHVSTEYGLYTNVDMLDFGTLRTMDDPKTLNLNVMHYGNKSIQILTIQISPPNPAITVNFNPAVMKPNKKFMKIASVTFSAFNSKLRRQNSGKLIISTNEKRKLEVPYHANVLHGTLAYSVGKTSFFVKNSPAKQTLTITNTFNETLVIYNATLPVDVQHIFSLSNFTPPVVVPSGKLISPLSLKFMRNSSDLSISSVLRLYTNASIFTIPVHCYSGKLDVKIGNSGSKTLDYGTVGIHENRSLTFTIINNNPVEVSIKEYGTDFEFARLKLVNVHNLRKNVRTYPHTHQNPKMFKSNNSVYSKQQNESSDSVVLKPKHAATFKIDVLASKKEGTYEGLVYMKTLYEVIKIPVYAKTVQGSLTAKPKKIKIEKAFPGRTEKYPLSVESTFEYPIKLKSLGMKPRDRRFELLKPDFLPQLPPKEKTHIGWLKFDPSYHTDEKQCYLCICEKDPACEQWHHSVSLPVNTWELDFNLLEKLRRKWDNYENQYDTSFNTSIVFDSSVIQSYTIPVQVSLAWPTLVAQSINFPATHVGNYSLEEMVITNPSDHPLIVQVLPLLNYPQPDGGLDLLSDRLIMDSFSLDLNGHSNFFIPDIRDGKQDHKSVHSSLGTYPSPNSLTMLLEPRQKKSIMVGFTPVDESAKNSIVVVRNNLTILDLVVVNGQGAHTNFAINNLVPGEKNSVLHFEIKHNHLEDCNKSTPKARVYPSFTVKRSFTATNKGKLPVHVVSMNINSYECEGYGFRILKCEPFILQPNTSVKIDITFSPDFSTSRVTRILKVITSIGESLDFALLATLPHEMLPVCVNALPRPFWEPYLHVVATVLMSTVFIFIIFFAYFDAQKYVVQCTFTASRGNATTLDKNLDLYTPGTVFDLNAMAKVKVRISDKKANELTKAHQRASKTTSLPGPAKNQHATLKRSDSLNSNNSVKEVHPSDSSNASSRKNSVNNSPQPEPKNEHNKHENKRVKRKQVNDSSRVTRSNVVAPTSEPVIITEEICDPWERDLMNKVRAERQQKMKNKPELTEENHKNKKAKFKGGKAALHGTLHKENSTGSSRSDEEQPAPGFTPVEHKSKTKKQRSDPPSPPAYQPGGSLDKLDDIPLSGPRPYATKEILVHKPSKTDTNVAQHPKGKTSRKRTSHVDKERLAMDTPTSPHAIAAAIVEAALVKSQQKKKSKDSSNSSSTKTSPKHAPNKEPVEAKKKKDSTWSSYFRRFGIGFKDEPSPEEVNKGNSMFYYDNLSILRASKQTTELKTPGSNNSEKKGFRISSNLSPDSAEFVPAAERINKVVGSNLKHKDTSWTTVDDSELLKRPPPGLKHPNTSIWGSDEFLSSPRDLPSPRGLPSPREPEDGWPVNKSLFGFGNEGGYSSLLSGNRSKFGFDFLGNRDGSPNLWERKDDFGSAADLWSSTTPVSSSSIWDTPDPTTTTGKSPRSRLGLGLDLKPVGEMGATEENNSPLDPFAIWGSKMDPALPYEGWDHDINKED